MYVCMYVYMYVCIHVCMGVATYMFVPYCLLMELTNSPGAYNATQGPKLVPLKNVAYNLSSISSVLVAPTLMA